jgi:hypothetical protein
MTESIGRMLRVLEKPKSSEPVQVLGTTHQALTQYRSLA